MPALYSTRALSFSKVVTCSACAAGLMGVTPGRSFLKRGPAPFLPASLYSRYRSKALVVFVTGCDGDFDLKPGVFPKTLIIRQGITTPPEVSEIIRSSFALCGAGRARGRAWGEQELVAESVRAEEALPKQRLAALGDIAIVAQGWRLCSASLAAPGADVEQAVAWLWEGEMVRSPGVDGAEREEWLLLGRMPAAQEGQAPTQGQGRKADSGDLPPE